MPPTLTAAFTRRTGACSSCPASSSACTNAAADTKRSLRSHATAFFKTSWITGLHGSRSMKRSASRITSIARSPPNNANTAVIPSPYTSARTSASCGRDITSGAAYRKVPIAPVRVPPVMSVSRTRSKSVSFP